jgi:uncharacterized protein YneF (UPF0154 family)
MLPLVIVLAALSVVLGIDAGFWFVVRLFLRSKPVSLNAVIKVTALNGFSSSSAQ